MDMRQEWRPRQTVRSRDRLGMTAEEIRQVLSGVRHGIRPLARVDEQGRVMELMWTEE